MKLVVDGDIYAFTYAAGHEEYVEVDEWLIPKWDIREMKAQWKGFVSRLPQHTELLVCFSDAMNFRKKVDPTYKAHRKASAKPVMYRPLVEWVKETYPCAIYPTLEADDLIGIMVTQAGYVGVSEDKDMRTIPGKHYSLKEGAVFSVSPEEADYFWMTQTLTGDATDGYKGLAGIGPKSAEKILGGAALVKDLWPRVKKAYLDAGSTEAAALVQARLSRILRSGDYDLKTKEVLLWKP